MKLLLWTCVIASLAAGWAAAQDVAAAEKIPPAVYHRTVFLGDSITDGDTYPKLVRDALVAAGLPRMIAINAGIGGDTSRGMRARLERDVLAFHPTLVMLSAGANDAMQNFSGDSYEENVGSIVQALNRENIPLIVLTPNILGPKLQAKAQTKLDMYEKILRNRAPEDGFRIAEVNQRQREAGVGGTPQLAPDDLHPNWEGQKMIARAVLDAMGYGDVKVPDVIADAPLPGVIAQWRVKRVDAKQPPLTEAAVALIKVDDSWTALHLPEAGPMADVDSNNRWLDGYRAQGASVSLKRQPGKYVGVATLLSDKAKSMQFHTGADLEQVWLNGKLIYQSGAIRGYHIGRESVTGELKEGENVIVITTGPVFFLSVTDRPMW